MADTIADTWHMFQVRRALLTDPSLAFSFHHVNATMRLPQIQAATASLLYINLLSILDDAMATQMTEEEYRRCGKLHNCITFLRARGKILDEAVLLAIKDRRNAIGHEPNKDATVDELTAAVAEVEEQLLSWGLIQQEPPYELRYERTGMRNASNPDIAFELDHFIRVFRGEHCVLEAKQTVSHWRAGK
jgi:hypothetical protein